MCDIYCVDELISGDWHVTNYASTYPSLKALWWQLLNSLTMPGSASWEPQVLTNTEKGRRKAIATGVMLEVRVSCCRLSQEEILVQYFEHEFKQQSMEWYCITSPRKKKLKSVLLSAGKIMASFLGWES